MKHAVLAVVTIVGFGILAADMASAFTARGGTRVNPVDQNVFEVVPKATSRGNPTWCAASEYARRVLGASWQDNIYVARSLGPSVTTNRRTAVHFTLNPQAIGIVPQKGSSLNTFPVGDFMSINVANTHCNRIVYEDR